MSSPTADLTQTLLAQGVTNPHTHQPYSAAMLFGLAGGLGFAYDWSDTQLQLTFHRPDAPFANLDTRLALPLIDGVRAGIADVLATAAGTPQMRRWADELERAGTRAGTARFADGRGLFPVLHQLFTQLQLGHPAGDNLRPLYRAFLAEVAYTFNSEPIFIAAKHYEYLASMWSQLGEEALPQEVPPFAQVKRLLFQQAFLTADEDVAGVTAVTAELTKLSTTLTTHFPTAVAPLMASLAERVRELAQAEELSLAVLRGAVDTLAP